MLTNKSHALPDDQLQGYLGPEKYIESDDAETIRTERPFYLYICTVLITWWPISNSRVVYLDVC